MARIITIHPVTPEPSAVFEARLHLDDGEVVAIPTDTLYGLASNATDPSAVERVYDLKGRGHDKPLLILVADLEQAETLTVDSGDLFRRLARAFWPGPLTLVVNASKGLPDALTAGTGSVGIRCPDSPIAVALVRACGYPLTATSANRSGFPACATAAEVDKQLGSQLKLIVDGGPAPETHASTLVDVRPGRVQILRRGAIGEERLRQYLQTN